MNFTNAGGMLAEAFRGSNYFGNGAILTIILIFVVLILITRNTTKWKILGLPVTIMFVGVFKTTWGVWGGLLITVAGIIYIISSLVPNLPNTLTLNFRDDIREKTGINRVKELRTYKNVRKGMMKAKDLNEINAEIKKKGSGYALREQLEAAKSIEKRQKNKDRKLKYLQGKLKYGILSPEEYNWLDKNKK